MIGVDNTFLGLLLGADSQAPVDPKTKKPIERLSERIRDLIEEWQLRKQKIIIPTPVLSEFLVLAADDSNQYLDAIDASPIFQVRPFDQKAAIELSAMYLQERAGMSANAKKRDKKADTKAKVKFDRQIVAIIKSIAKPNEEVVIYSDDSGVAAFGARHDIKVVGTWELPAPTMKAVPLPGMDETTATKTEIKSSSKEIALAASSDPKHPSLEQPQAS